VVDEVLRIEFSGLAETEHPKTHTIAYGNLAYVPSVNEVDQISQYASHSWPVCPVPRSPVTGVRDV